MEDKLGGELVRRQLHFTIGRAPITIEVDMLGDGEVVPECNDETTLADLEDIWERQGDRYVTFSISSKFHYVYFSEDSGLKLWNTSLVFTRFLCLVCDQPQ